MDFLILVDNKIKFKESDSGDQNLDKSKFFKVLKYEWYSDINHCPNT